MKKQQSGFTLIELIMVIVVLGILAAFALPRFANFSGDARLAAMQGVAGAIKSASAVAHSQALVKPEADGSVKLEGQTIAMVDKYPAPTAAGIEMAAQITAADFTVVTTTANTYELQDKTKAACKVTYKMATGDVAPTITTSALTSGNCN